MAVKYQNCEQCGNYDITGYVACINKQLCPTCTSPYTGNVDPDLVRQYIMKQYDNMHRPIVAS